MDAGCGEEAIVKICRLYAGGRIREAVKILRKHRCRLMEQLHESQGRVDCLDFLVRQMEREDGNGNGRHE